MQEKLREMKLEPCHTTPRERRHCLQTPCVTDDMRPPGGYWCMFLAVKGILSTDPGNMEEHMPRLDSHANSTVSPNSLLGFSFSIHWCEKFWSPNQRKEG